MNCQMIRVISSPSSSTTVPWTLILAMSSGAPSADLRVASYVSPVAVQAYCLAELDGSGSGRYQVSTRPLWRGSPGGTRWSADPTVHRVAVAPGGEPRQDAAREPSMREVTAM